MARTGLSSSKWPFHVNFFFPRIRSVSARRRRRRHSSLVALNRILQNIILYTYNIRTHTHIFFFFFYCHSAFFFLFLFSRKIRNLRANWLETLGSRASQPYTPYMRDYTLKVNSFPRGGRVPPLSPRVHELLTFRRVGARESSPKNKRVWKKRPVSPIDMGCDNNTSTATIQKGIKRKCPYYAQLSIDMNIIHQQS